MAHSPVPQVAPATPVPSRDAAVRCVVPLPGAAGLVGVRVAAGWDGVARLGTVCRIPGPDAAADPAGPPAGRVRLVVRPHGGAPGERVERWLDVDPDGRVEAEVVVPGAAAWQPRAAGCGAPHRYLVDLELVDGAGVVTDRASRLVAFRGVSIAPLAGAGTPAVLHVNGRPVPLLPVEFAVRPGLAVRDALVRAADAGATLVRLSGAAPAELAAVRDVCDDLGLLVRSVPPSVPVAWPGASLRQAAVRRYDVWRSLRDVLGSVGACLAGGRDDLRLVLVDSRGQGEAAHVHVQALTAAGRFLGAVDGDVVLAPGHTGEVPLAGRLGAAVLDRADLVVADVAGERVVRWLSPRGRSPQRALTVTVRVPDAAPGAPERVEVEVAADVVVRDLCLLAELAVPEAVVDWQLLTVLPGEPVTFTVTGAGVRNVAAERWADLLYDDRRVHAADVTMAG